MRKRLTMLLAALGLAAGLVAAPVVVPSPGAKTWAAPYPVACAQPVQSTWGWGQICWQGSTWWVTVKDILTDGYCVDAVLSNGSHVAHACSTSPVTSGPQSGTRYAKAVRGDGRYMTIPAS